MRHPLVARLRKLSAYACCTQGADEIEKLRRTLIAIVSGIRRDSIDYDMGDIEVAACHALGIKHTDELPEE